MWSMGKGFIVIFWEIDWVMYSVMYVVWNVFLIGNFFRNLWCKKFDWVNWKVKRDILLVEYIEFMLEWKRSERNGMGWGMIKYVRVCRLKVLYIGFINEESMEYIMEFVLNM